MMSEQEKMLAEMLYTAQDPELVAAHRRALRLTQRYNATGEDQAEEREALIQELLGSFGEDGVIMPPFRCDYGSQIEIGDHFFANYDCLFLDVCSITIGNHVMLGPRVCLYTAAHPLSREVRDTGLEYGKLITIGNSVWIGGNVIVNPGVTIGNEVVIGAGSVVTHDLPDGVIAAGNPCRVLRRISDEDRKFWLARQQEWQSR